MNDETQNTGQQSDNTGDNDQQTTTPASTPPNDTGGQQTPNIKDTPEYKALEAKLRDVTNESIKRKEQLREMAKQLSEDGDMTSEKPKGTQTTKPASNGSIDPDALIERFTALIDERLSRQGEQARLGQLKETYRLTDADVAVLEMLPNDKREDFAKRLAPPGVVDNTSRGNPSGEGTSHDSRVARLDAAVKARHGTEAPGPFDTNIQKAQGGGAIKP